MFLRMVGEYGARSQSLSAISLKMYSDLPPNCTTLRKHEICICKLLRQASGLTIASKMVMFEKIFCGVLKKKKKKTGKASVGALAAVI